MAVTDLPPLSGRLTRDGDSVHADTAWPAKDVHTLTGWALERGLDLPALTVSRPTLEDVYLRLVGDDETGVGDEC